jgi:predicted nucleic-acid-binding Zn-ribbon protein
MKGEREMNTEDSVDYFALQDRVKELADKLKDSVEVVRCKDCRFSEIFQNDSSGVMAMYCRAFTLDRMIAEDDFCSYGERREESDGEL